MSTNTVIKQKRTRTMPRNLSLEVWYRKKLLRMVKAMSNNAKKEILRAWKVKSPVVQDSGFATTLKDVLRSLKYNWKNEFSHLSDHVAREYARRADAGTTGHLKTLLKEVGFGVKFKQTQEINNILQATIAENVSLIKNIHSAYFTQVETIIMQGIKNGRDLGYISKELQDRFNITERRAVIIARDQTNKATGALSRARTLETGLTQATWVHIGGKKTDRSTHEAMDGKEFDLREGLYDPAVKRKIMPGELINCNCSYDILIPDTGQEGGLPFYSSKGNTQAKASLQKTPTPKEQRIAQRQKQEIRPYTMPTKSFADYEKNADSLQAAAKAYFDENLRDKELSTAATNENGVVEKIKVLFSGGSWKKLKHKMSSDNVRPRIVPEIAQILQGVGKYEDLHKERDGDFTHFYAFEGVALGEYLVTIKVGARKNDQENSVYSMTYKQKTSDSGARLVNTALTSQDGTEALCLMASEPKAFRISDALSKKISPIYEIVNIEITRLTA